jgi:hypothetical protein
MNMRAFLLTGLLFFSATARAGGIPVFSAVEYGQQLLTHIEVLNDALVQLEKLGVMDESLVTQIESLTTQYQQFQQQIQNATKIYGDLAYVDDSDLRNILDDINTAYSKVETLDPSNPYFDEQSEQIIYGKYGDPRLRASDTLSGNTDALQAMDQRGEHIEAGYDDYIHFQKKLAARNRLSDGRKDMISSYQTKLDSLGDSTLLENQRISAYQLNLMLSQQEEMIDRITDISSRSARKDLEEFSDKREAYEKKIKMLDVKANTVFRAE